jgi:hypothetical protein
MVGDDDPLLDHPEFVDLGLRGGREDDRGHLSGRYDHVGHPRPGLGTGEVTADPGPDGVGYPDVQRVFGRVGEEVHAGAWGRESARCR